MNKSLLSIIMLAANALVGFRVSAEDPPATPQVPPARALPRLPVAPPDRPAPARPPQVVQAGQAPAPQVLPAVEPPQPPPLRPPQFNPPGAGVARVSQVAGLPQAPIGRAGEALKTNYLVTLTIAQGEEQHACSIVTASSSVRFNAVLGDPPVVPIQFSGTLSDHHEDGGVTLMYAVEAQLPLGDPKIPANIGKVPESASGQLKVNLGSTYPIYNSGPRTYTLSVEAYEAPKRAK